MNDEFKMILERVEMLTEELNRLKQALHAAAKGVPFNEAFNEEVYQEAKSLESEVFNKSSELMEHLLELAYCPSDVDYTRDNKHLIHEIKKVFHRDLYNILRWGTKKPYTLLINYVKNNIKDAYDNAISLFKNDFKKNSMLNEVTNLFPVECPWTLEELMEDSVSDLLSKLPNRLREEEDDYYD